MVALDDSVTNLQEFNALLKEIHSRLHDRTRSLESKAGALQQLESQAGGSLDELNGTVDRLDGAFETQSTHAGEEVQQIAAAAAKGSDSRLPDAEQDIEERASSLEQALGRDGEALDGDWSELRSAGFEPADSVLASLASEAETLQQQAEGAFDDADGELDSARGEATGAESAVEGAASSFASEADGQRSAAQEVAQVASELEQDAAQIESALQAMTAELEQTYDTLGQEAGQVADEMVTEVSGLIDGAGATIAEDGREVEQEVSRVGEGASAQLLNALSQTEALVMAGETATEPCATLVPELAKCRDIAADIERLLQAMG